MKNTGKSLAILSALFSSAIVGIDIYQDKIDFGNIFTSLFSVYICLGAWHIFSDHEKGIQTDIPNLYTWPARYFQRFSGTEKP